MNLNRISLFGKNLRHALSEPQRERLQDSVNFYFDKTLPAMQTIVEKIGIHSSGAHIVESLRDHGEMLATLLRSDHFATREFSSEMVKLEQQIALHVDQILHSLGMIRKELFASFQCNPSHLITEVLQKRKESLEQNHLQVHNNVSGDQPIVVIREAEFSRAFLTVLDFFLKRPHSTKKRILSLCARTHLDRWLLEVRDSGIVFATHLWQVFFDGSTTGSTLVEASEILQKYEGDVSVKESIPEKGTTILLRLKLRQRLG